MRAFSVLDLAPIREGHDAADALRSSRELIAVCESAGYERYWVAEHHNFQGIASAATAVVIGHLAEATSTIRVGAGGVMLPNHAPYVIAEQFGTLQAIHGDRIDLGLGRAPGTDMLTIQALRRDAAAGAERFPQDVQELIGWLEPARPQQRLRAVPGEGSRVPVWILGSSLYGAQLAAALGLPYAFASHFAPQALDAALAAYRSGYTPSDRHPEPHAMPTVNVVCADSDEEAQLLFTSVQQSFVNLRSGRPGKLPPPDGDVDSWMPDALRPVVGELLSQSFVGSQETVAAGLRAFIERTGADELMIAGSIYDPDARARSFQLAAGVLSALRA